MYTWLAHALRQTCPPDPRDTAVVEDNHLRFKSIIVFQIPGGKDTTFNFQLFKHHNTP